MAARSSEARCSALMSALVIPSTSRLENQPSSRRSGITSSGRLAPSRSTVIASGRPSAPCACTSAPMACQPSTGSPAMPTMRSPLRMPARSAGLASDTSPTTAGTRRRQGSMPMASSVFSSLKSGPRRPRSSAWSDSAPLALSTVTVMASRSSACVTSSRIACDQVRVSSPSTATIASPGSIPASAASPLDWPISGRDSGMPTRNISQKASTAKTRLKAGPAAVIAIRVPTDLLLKARARSSGSTGPSRSSSILT